MSTATGRQTRVVGWYHSHPHITVLPSHVDINTQKDYQMMDGNFVGLIFSVFNKDKDNVASFVSLLDSHSFCLPARKDTADCISIQGPKGRRI